MRIGYSPRVDALLARLGTDLTERDFADLALACADQAGVSLGAQNSIEECLRQVLQPVCATSVHEALKADEAAWSNLRLIGVQKFDADEEGPAYALEMRNCTCKSTLCKEVTP